MARSANPPETAATRLRGLVPAAVLVLATLSAPASAGAQPAPGPAAPAATPEPGLAAVPEIVIDGSLQNTQQLPLVLDAIKGRLCPCFDWRVQDDRLVNEGRVNEGGGEGMIDSFCECYGQHTVGCNLILDLVGDEEEVTIGDEANAGSSYWISAGPQGAAARTLKLNVQNQQEVPTTDDQQEQSRAERLAHELVHAHHHLNDNVPRVNPNQELSEENYDRVTEERNATRGTNRIREEIGEDERTEYGLGDGAIQIDTGAADPHLDTGQRFCD